MTTTSRVERPARWCLALASVFILTGLLPSAIGCGSDTVGSDVTDVPVQNSEKETYSRLDVTGKNSSRKSYKPTFDELEDEIVAATEAGEITEAEADKKLAYLREIWNAETGEWIKSD